MRQLLTAVVVLFSIGGPATAAEPVLVSMVELIAAPERTAGKQVIVIGFAHLEFEANVLCLHKVDYDNGVSKNCLRLSGSSDGFKKWRALSDSYVRVKGKFKWDERMRDDIVSGYLIEIAQFERWPRETSK